MYDAIVIGSGPGGYSCASEISDLGGKVALVERDKVGGTCTNYGCIPTKSLISSAELIEDLAQCSKKGIDATFEIDFEKIVKRKNHIVDTIVRGIELNIRNKNIDFFKGDAHIILKNKVRIKDLEIEAKNIVIATGSKPIKIFSGENILTSREILELTSIPEKLVIIGGGVEGIEFGMISQILGSKVTIIEAMERLLPNFDIDISVEIEKILKRKGIKIIKGKRADFNDKLVVDDEVIPFDKILVSVGRKPYFPELSGLNPEKVNEKMQTEIDNVFAVGDVTNKNQLAHVAIMQGIVAANNIMGYERSMDYSCVPGCVYTLPEIASVGIRETDDHDVYKTSYSANAKARCSDKIFGFIKIIADKNTKRIKGVHIVGENATDLIATAVIIIKKKMMIKDIKDMIFPHPTYGELFFDAVK